MTVTIHYTECPECGCPKIIQSGRYTPEKLAAVDELLALLEDRYLTSETPLCRVCGDELTVAASERGHVRWACKHYKYTDEGREVKEGRKWDIRPGSHYAKSITETRMGDSSVVELIKEFKILYKWLRMGR